MKSHWLKRTHTIFTQNKFTLFVASLFVIIAVVYTYGLLWLPPEYDEVLVSNAALNCPSNVFVEQVVWIKGQCFPIMLSSYIGGFMAVPESIVFMIFGSGLFQLRLVRDTLSILSFIFLFVSAKQIKNKRFAILFVALLAFDFQLWSNLRFEGTAVLPFFLKSVVIVLSTTYYKSRDTKLLFFIGSVVALSIWTKFDAVFFYISLLVPGLLLYREKIINVSKYFSQLTTFFSGLAIGFLPFFFYISRNFQRFLFVGKEVGGNGSLSVIIPKLQGIYLQFASYDDIWYLFRQSYFPPLIIAILISIVWLYYFAAYSTKPKNKIATLLLISTFVFYLCFLLYSGLKLPHHRILIYPIPQLFLAFFLYKQNKWVTTLFFVIFTSIFINGMFHFNYLRTTFEPQAAMTNEIYSLSDYLISGNGKVLVGDWGIANQLLLLSSGKIDLKEIAFAANTKSASEFSDALIHDVDSCQYVVLRHKEKAIFKQADENLRAVIDGELVYTDQVFEVYKCKTN